MTILVPESSIIIEYLDQRYPGATRFIPQNPDTARRMRLRDRFFDIYVNDQVGKIVGDRLRPAGQNDTIGVERAYAILRTGLDLIEADMADKGWAMGEDFTMADCAAAPALFYANVVTPFEATHISTARYLRRLRDRPSFARTVSEVRPI